MFFEATLPRGSPPPAETGVKPTIGGLPGDNVPSDKTAANLQAVRAEAVGNPVTIHGPSNDVRSRTASRLRSEDRQHHAAWRSGRGTLSAWPRDSFPPGLFPARFDGPGRPICRGGSRLAERDLARQPEAANQGALDAAAQFPTAQANHLLSIEGDAHLHMVGRGVLDAERDSPVADRRPRPGQSTPGKMEFVTRSAHGHRACENRFAAAHRRGGSTATWFEQVRGFRAVAPRQAGDRRGSAARHRRGRPCSSSMVLARDCKLPAMPARPKRCRRGARYCPIAACRRHSRCRCRVVPADSRRRRPTGIPAIAAEDAHCPGGPLPGGLPPQ